MYIILSVYLAGFVAGLAIDFRNTKIKRHRRPQPRKLIEWDERPVWVWASNSFATVIIWMYIGTLITINAIILLEFGRYVEFMQSSVLYLFILALMASGLGMACNEAIFSRWIMPPETLIWSGGIVRGFWLHPWKRFSHFTVKGDQILLYSAIAPDVVHITLSPRDSTIIPNLVDILQNHLPSTPPQVEHWYLTRAGITTLLTAISLAALALSGYVYYRYLPTFSAYYAVNVLIYVYLFFRLLRRFGFEWIWK